jgi:hypothetical protein
MGGSPTSGNNSRFLPNPEPGEADAEIRSATKAITGQDYKATRDFTAQNSTEEQIRERQIGLLQIAGFTNGEVAAQALSDDKKFKEYYDRFTKDGNEAGLKALDDFKYLEKVRYQLPAPPASALRSDDRRPKISQSLTGI